MAHFLTDAPQFAGILDKHGEKTPIFSAKGLGVFSSSIGLIFVDGQKNKQLTALTANLSCVVQVACI